MIGGQDATEKCEGRLDDEFGKMFGLKVFPLSMERVLLFWGLTLRPSLAQDAGLDDLITEKSVFFKRTFR